jgi:hypothetical protein
MLVRPAFIILLIIAGSAGAFGQATASVSVIVDGSGDSVQQFAAAELSRYIEKITGERAAGGEGASRYRIRIGSSCRGEACLAPDDGFTIQRDGAETVIRGNNSRGVLYGAYAFLERLGVRWFGPGSDREYVPRRAIDWNAPLKVSETPAISERILVYYPYHYDQVESWIDFAGKARLNRICFHYGWPTLDWFTALRGRLMPGLKKRGITIEVGGHLLSLFLPRTLFKSKPDWFRMNEKGQRVPDWNFNPFHAEAVDHVASGVARYFAQMPEATMFHAWADDIDGGGWSHEPGKEQYTPADQSLIVSNAIVNALRQRKPNAEFPYLAYHDTLQAPRKVKPVPGIVYFCGLRERCYAHALDDPDCGLNRKYREAFESGLPVFGGGKTEVIEYYTDQVLFQSMVNPPIPGVIGGDARYYAKLGVARVGSLMVNTAEWVTPPVNLFLYPKALWNPSGHLTKSIEEYASTYFGDAKLAEYFRELGEGSRALIRICDYTHPGDSWYSIQPSRESDDALESHVRWMEAGLTGPLARAETILEAAIHRTTDIRKKRRLERERDSLQYTLLQGRLYYHLLKGQWLLQVHANRHDEQAGLTAALESPLARHTWEKLREFIARSGLMGEPLIPDPEFLARRARSYARADGCTIDNLGQLMMNGVIGYTVNGPGGSRAAMWADRPGTTLKVAGIEWRDEFGRPLEAAPDLGKSPGVIYSPMAVDQVMKTIMARGIQ